MNKETVFNRTASLISDLHELEHRLSSDTDKGALTPLQQDILSVLYFASPKTLSSLSECMNMNLPNTSREVKKLVQQKMILKDKDDKDKRITRLSLSDIGKKQFESVLVQMKDRFFRESGEWPEERCRQLIDGISTIEKILFGKK